MNRVVALLTMTMTVVAVASCGGDDATSATTSTTTSAPEPVPSVVQGDGLFPDVLDVSARQGDDGTWTFDVTISSPYDSPQRYADAWRILAPDGTEFGIHELAHDHAGEQPFTRSLAGVVIPDDVTEVTIEAHDQINGWGGTEFGLTLD